MSAGLLEAARRVVADDERIALAVSVPEWREGSSWLTDLLDPMPSQRQALGLPREWTSVLTAEDVRHIARHDPASVLRRCKARRELLDRYEALLGRLADWDNGVDQDEDDDEAIHDEMAAGAAYAVVEEMDLMLQAIVDERGEGA